MTAKNLIRPPYFIIKGPSSYLFFSILWNTFSSSTDRGIGTVSKLAAPEEVTRTDAITYFSGVEGETGKAIIPRSADVTNTSYGNCSAELVYAFNQPVVGLLAWRHRPANVRSMGVLTPFTVVMCFSFDLLFLPFFIFVLLYCWKKNHRLSLIHRLLLNYYVVRVINWLLNGQRGGQVTSEPRRCLTPC